MSHNFTKPDGVFPHKKDGGVLGKQHFRSKKMSDSLGKALKGKIDSEKPKRKTT